MINFNIEEIKPICSQFGIELDGKKIEDLNKYGNLLLEWNQKMNLTAITEPKDVLYKHFYDCILFFKNTQVPENARVIDVGTGAGFPGMVLKIVRPDLKVTLLDSLNKRLIFLNEVITSLSLSDIETVHLRAEEGGQNNDYREKYDIACARAVAALPILMEYCTPYVKQGGLFIAMKGPSAKEELSLCQNAINELKISKEKIVFETLTGDEQHAFVVFRKISQTPSKYPRKSAIISKQPL